MHVPSQTVIGSYITQPTQERLPYAFQSFRRFLFRGHFDVYVVLSLYTLETLPVDFRCTDLKEYGQPVHINSLNLDLNFKPGFENFKPGFKTQSAHLFFKLGFKLLNWGFQQTKCTLIH